MDSHKEIRIKTIAKTENILNELLSSYLTVLVTKLGKLLSRISIKEKEAQI